MKNSENSIYSNGSYLHQTYNLKQMKKEEY